MKIILAGGTGQIGRLLLRAFLPAGHDCVVLTRAPARAEAAFVRQGLVGSVRACPWDGRHLGPWASEFEGADAVINLAGRSVDCRYTAANLSRMMTSRTIPTHLVGAAITKANQPPRVWLNASTATIYAHRHDAPNDEHAGRIGGSEPDVPPLWQRSVEIGLAWEAALFAADTPRTRRVALRSAMVMSPDRGGVFSAFATLCRFGVGRHGSGEQFVSWIHDRDFVAAVEFLLGRADLDGLVNLAAPEPLPNRDFVAALHAALGSRLAVPMPAWLLEVGALVRRTETELLLKSRRVIPGRLLAEGFRFRHPAWPEAARELVGRWRPG